MPRVSPLLSQVAFHPQASGSVFTIAGVSEGFHGSCRDLVSSGLSPVFSLRRDLPPILGCIPKQPDSWKAPREAAKRRPDGVLTLSDAGFHQTWGPAATEGASIDYNSPKRFSSWAIPVSLAVTRGILVSFFSSAY